MPRLGVNIDHVATVRQARREGVPDLLKAAAAVVQFGADGITVHLREDRRHIQDSDVFALKDSLAVPLNLEMSTSPEIVNVAMSVRPAWSCLVPEKRAELTTEGGLNVQFQRDVIVRTIAQLKNKGIRVSLFVEPDLEIVRLCHTVNADAVEIHTGRYAQVFCDEAQRKLELVRIKNAAVEASALGLIVNAGHGLNVKNVEPLLSTHIFHEFNIGFSIVARALFVGLGAATSEMKVLLEKGRSN